MAAAYPRLFEPIEIGRHRARNRIAVTAHSGALPSHRYLRYIETRAAGGVGMVIASGGHLGVAALPLVAGPQVPDYFADLDAIQPDPSTAAGVTYYDETVIPLLRQRAAAVHRHGALCFAQVFHLGPYRESDGFLPASAPSPIPDEEEHSVPHELTPAEIERLVFAYAHSIRRTRAAGMDGAELHAGHGYLVNTFLSPHWNRRQDRYGGSLENRMRFVEEVLGAADELAGGDFPIGLRIGASDFVSDGLAVDEVAEIARRLSPRLAYVNVTAGNTTGLMQGLGLAYASPWLVDPGHNLELGAVIRSAVDIPVLVAGRILEPEQAEAAIAAGQCDLVGMVRALIADPQWPAKAAAGLAKEIRRCVGLNECHGYHGNRGHLVCAINPAAGREAELEVGPADTARLVLVAGGGPAGMEAALIAANRGHRVVLCERGPQLGGTLRALARAALPQLSEYVAHQAREVAAAGVEVRTATEVGPALFRELAPDVVIVATGAVQRKPGVPGVESPHVVTAQAVLDGTAQVGEHVLVVGELTDDVGPILVADPLAREGHRVHVITELLMLGERVEHRTLHIAMKRLLDRGVAISTLTVLDSIDGGSVRVLNRLTRAPATLEQVDTVVLAGGRRAESGLAARLESEGARCQVIGDALAPRRLVHAVLDGARVASVI